MAAGAQASIGSVPAGGAFATLTSAAMGGYGMAVVVGATQAAGLGIAGLGAAAAAVKRLID